MILPNITAWTLIVVLNGGNVSHNEGFESFAACQDARQLVLTGRTVEAEKVYKEEQDKTRKVQEAAQEKYKKSHPTSLTWSTAYFTADSLNYTSTIVAECVPEVQ